jgi:predicted esterase
VEAPAGLVGPTVTRYAAPSSPTGVVLMLHGGKDRGDDVVDHRSASWRRSAAMARAIATEAESAGVAVWLLRYRHRGWNGGAGPVSDARWALDRVRAELGALPVALLGHSMGARTAVHVADDPQVHGVVALAPWFPGGEPVAALAGKRLVAAHGSRDRITSARATRAYVERAHHAGADASFIDMGRVGHYLLRRVGTWNHLALSRSLELLADD